MKAAAFSVSIILVFAALALGPAHASPRDAIARGANKAMVKRFGWGGMLAKERLRDMRTPARSLAHDRLVFRYTSREQARRELRHGLAPGSHMTARGGAGRPLTSAHAQQRFGLRRIPQVRMSIRPPGGQLMRHNRVWAGAAGNGEMTSPARIPRESIRRVVNLH